MSDSKDLRIGEMKMTFGMFGIWGKPKQKEVNFEMYSLSSFCQPKAKIIRSRRGVRNTSRFNYCLRRGPWRVSLTGQGWNLAPADRSSSP